MTGWPRRFGWWACSTEAKKASMSTSRITRPSSFGPGPCPAQHPARAARVVAQLVGVAGGALDREITQQRLPFAAHPLARDFLHSHHPALPAEAQRLYLPLHEGGEHVHRVAQGLEHGTRPRPSIRAFIRPSRYCTLVQ